MMDRVSCIKIMIPIIFFVGLFGFFKVKTLAEGKEQRGTLDQIIYYYLNDISSTCSFIIFIYQPST